MRRSSKGLFAAASLVLILGLTFLGCGPGKPKETAAQKAERLLVKGDSASLREARKILQEALAAEPNSAFMHALLGKAYMQEGKAEANRGKSEDHYNLAIAEMEKALELHGQAGAPIEVIRQMIDACRERAYLPKRFDVEKDIKVGVGPWEMKAMEKAFQAFELGRSRFPNDPAFGEDKAKEMQQELAAVKALYVENVHRAWLSRPSGFVSPDKQKQVQ